MLSQEVIVKSPNLVFTHIDRIDARSGRKSVLLEKEGLLLFAPDLSPDGRWVVFQARELSTYNQGLNKEQLFIAPMSADGPVDPARWVAITDLKYFDANPMWSRDGKNLYFISDRDGSSCLWALRLDQGTKKPVGAPFAVKHFHGNPRRFTSYPQFCVGRDRIIISLDQVQSDLWMMQLPK